MLFPSINVVDELPDFGNIFSDSPGMQMGMRPMMPGQHSATMPGLRPPNPGMDMSGGPPAKKSRPEETLIPEDQFLRSNPANVSFQVSVPKVEKEDWNCRGQLIHISMPLTSSFSDVKQKIEAETGMPPAKQKLQCEGVFVKGNYRGNYPQEQI